MIDLRRHPVALADCHRPAIFAAITTAGELLVRRRWWLDDNNILWAGARLDTFALGVTWVESLYFDPQTPLHLPKRYRSL